MPHDPNTELVDVIDDRGAVVDVVTRRDMRELGLPHRCTYMLVFNRRGELLIHQRTATKDSHPSKWDVAVGGVLSAGESFDESARRELLEELGVEAEPTLLFPFRYADAHTAVHAKVYRVDHDGPFRFQPEEVARGVFVTMAELEWRIQVDPFCPDGLEVWREYQRRAAT